MNKIFFVDEAYDGMRIDRYLKIKLGKIPQSLIEKSLRNAKIKLNKKKIKSSIKLKTNDKIELFNFLFKNKIIQKKIKFEPSNTIIKENENLIIDNNENFVIINKQSGISVQGGTKSKKNLIDIFSKSQIFNNTKPFSVHRLDKDTSGIFILAKNRKTAQLLTSLFRLRKIHKTYIALCHGEFIKEKGLLKNNLVRYEGNNRIVELAETLFKVIDKNNKATLIQMKPITGRKHQLRKQLFILGHSIFGDQKYSNQVNNKSINKNLMLHSYEVKFMINDKKFTYRASLPEYFKKMLMAKRLSFLN